MYFGSKQHIFIIITLCPSKQKYNPNMLACFKKQSSNSMSFIKSFLPKLMFLLRQQTHFCAGKVKASWVAGKRNTTTIMAYRWNTLAKYVYQCVLNIVSLYVHMIVLSHFSFNNNLIVSTILRTLPKLEWNKFDSWRNKQIHNTPVRFAFPYLGTLTMFFLFVFNQLDQRVQVKYLK